MNFRLSSALFLRPCAAQSGLHCSGPSAFPVSDGPLQLQSPTSAFTQPAPYLGHAWLYRGDGNTIPEILLGRPLHKPSASTSTPPMPQATDLAFRCVGAAVETLHLPAEPHSLNC